MFILNECLYIKVLKSTLSNQFVCGLGKIYSLSYTSKGSVSLSLSVQIEMIVLFKTALIF